MFGWLRIVVLLAAWQVGAAGAEDWPQWGGRDGRNMVSEEKGLPDSFVPGKKRPDGSGIDPATTKNVRWVARLGSQTYGNPTVADGRVFVGTNDADLNDPRYRSTKGGAVKCFDEATGKLLWQFVVPRLETKDPNFNFDNLDLGVCSSPTVDGNRVYLVTNRCEVLCLNVQGAAIWRYDMIGELKVFPQDASNCSVLVHGDLLYVCTSNGVDRSHIKVPSPLAPSLIALDKHTGRLAAFDDEKIGTRMLHGEWSSPSLSEVNGRTLIFYGGGDGLCYAFEALKSIPPTPVPLKKVWWFDCNPPQYKIRDGKPVDYRSGDVREHKGNNNDGTFIGPSEIIATPVFYNNRVYVATGQDPLHGRGKGMLSCIDAARTGDVTITGMIWRYNGLDRSLSTVSVADGLLYVADIRGALHCLEADTGQVCWVHETGAETWGSTLVADGRVYLGTKKSFLVFAAGREPKLLSDIHLGAAAWCTPVTADGVLYVASQRYLWAVQSPRQ